MKKKKGFLIISIIVGIILLLYLEINKNTILGWILTIALIVGFNFLHYKKLYDKKWWMKLISWVVMIALFAGITFVSQPREKQLDAVKNKNPKVTDVVTVAQGDLIGVYNEDESVAVYAGIPYAKPPVGELRWVEPQEPDKWEGVRSCDTFAPMSMQNYNAPIYDVGSRLVGYHNYKFTFADNYKEARSEDSLYLNVWAPADIKAGDDVPVIVYIHGGSLTGGQSYYQDYNGETFAKNGVVFVSIDYRVGVFGYLATKQLADESPNNTTGNYGLLDQIQALKWVNENIKAFGGDANNITIAGESAGSSSVNALCVSPLSKGLFKRAIAESSGICGVEPYHTFRTYDEALETGAEIMETFNCSTMDEMRSLSAEELLSVQSLNSDMTIDGYAITEAPYLTYEKGENHEEALLNGFNGNEAYAFLMFSNNAKLDNYKEKYEKVVGDYADDVIELLPAATDDEAKQNYNDFMGLAWFGYSHYTWSNLVAAEERPVYLYFFNKDNGSIGTWHAGEMPYAYGNLDLSTGNFDELDEYISDCMVKYWTNFAKTGDPNGASLPVWDKYNDSRTKAMTFDEETGMKELKSIELMKVIDKYQQSLK